MKNLQLFIGVLVPLFCILITPSLGEETLLGRCVKVADGDTISVEVVKECGCSSSHIVRLDGIDAPESRQSFGREATEYLSRLVYQKDVRVVFSKKDRYGRILGRVYVGEANVNLDLVKSGMAWHYKQYSKDLELGRAEESARSMRKGLWREESPVPPWEFRRKPTSDTIPETK